MIDPVGGALRQKAFQSTCSGTAAGRCEKRKTFIVASSSPIVSGIAGRYASALFELAREANALDQVSTALDRFSALLNESEDLDRLVRNPVFTAEEQVAALSAVLAKAGIDGLGANFLKLAASKRRLFAVRGMIAGYRALVAEELGIVSAEVTVASPMSDKNRAAVQAALEGQSGKKIALTEKVDPAIIGGLVVKMGSRMIDASLKTKLNAMKLAMNNG